MLEKKEDILIVDSKTASMGQGYLVLECAKYSKEGVEFEKIKSYVQKKLIEKQKQVEEQSSELASKIEKLN